MAVMTCRYFSDVLELNTTATVILPDRWPSTPPERLPVLYLLHGMSDDDSTWTRRTSIERYVEDRGIAVVMPAAHRSFYVDQAEGYPYWTHIAEEVPSKMTAFFPISRKREETFVAGLSMGGYGAIKLALRHPDRFAAAASLSGALNAARRPDRHPEEWHRTFGSSTLAVANSDDLLALLASAEPSQLPRLFAWCGLQDWILDDSRTFKDSCRTAGVSITYEESDGDHDWAAWDQQIQRVLEWLET